MLQCVACGNEYPPELTSCPEDGCPLEKTPYISPTAAERKGLPSRPAPLEPGSSAGEYRILEKIGEGGMGTVYSAIHPVIGKRAAVKVIQPQLSSDARAVGRFVQEAQTVNRIRHPGIVDVFAFGILPDGRRFFVMEWLEGLDLRARMKQGPIPLDEALELFEQICDALAATHAQGVVHRDLKPANIFVLSTPGPTKIKLLDFGIAKLDRSGGQLPPASIETQTGVVLGSPSYMSPEQIRGDAADPRADIYALGSILYELAAGRPVFFAKNNVELMSQHLQTAPLPPSVVRKGLSRELDQLALGMLAKQREARPTLDQIRSRVRHLRRSLRPKAVQRWVFAALGSCGLLLAAAAGSAFLLHPRTNPQQPPTPAVASPPPAKPVSQGPTPLAVPAQTPTATASRAIGTVVVRSNVGDARIELDGQALAKGVDRVQVASDVQHQLRVTAPGHEAFKTYFVVSSGHLVDIPVLLRRTTSATRTTRRRSRDHRTGDKSSQELINPF